MLLSTRQRQELVNYLLDSQKQQNILLTANVDVYKRQPVYRQNIFFIIAVVSIVQIAFIEGSRIWLYNCVPTRFDYCLLYTSRCV